MRFEELPKVLEGMRTWGAIVGDYQFVISHENGSCLRPEDRDEWIGYTASYKLVRYNPMFRTPTVRIDGRWKKFTEAEAACRDALKRLLKPN